MMGRGFEDGLLSSRKLLIRQTDEYGDAGPKVRTKLHRIKRGSMPIGLISLEDAIPTGFPTRSRRQESRFLRSSR
jgi:hypothetical protein